MFTNVDADGLSLRASHNFVLVFIKVFRNTYAELSDGQIFNMIFLCNLEVKIVFRSV